MLILARRWLHRALGLEVFAAYGRSFFLLLGDATECARLLRTLARFRAAPGEPAEAFARTGLTRRWAWGEVSNFAYLLALNAYSGRSFNNSSLYPIMPWVVADYGSASLRLGDADFFRDLSRPVGLLGRERLWDIQRRQCAPSDAPFFHFSSYASSPIAVFMWLMRMEPFAKLHVRMQGGRFDHAGRLFASVGDAWRMATSQPNDFRELTLEFFCQPAFLVNANGFDLGTANGVAIDDVVLPRWAARPVDFVYLHRKALESAHASSGLPGWIDLFFGCRQRGPEAAAAYNTYNSLLYEDAWATAGPDMEDVVAATMTQCGQIPAQMFTAPHPRRAARQPGVRWPPR
jgi:hypothetical protein